MAFQTLGLTRKTENEATEIKGDSGFTLAIRAKRALDVYASTGSAITALNTFVFPSSWNVGGNVTGGFGWLSIAPSDFPYDKINAYNSSVAMACINWIEGAFREAKPVVFKTTTDGERQFLPNHRLQLLLNRPNPYYTYSKLMEATLISRYLDGNAYWFKERGDGGTGITRALYYIPHYSIEPKAEGGDFVSYYDYTVNGKTYRLPPERIIHFRNGLDPYNMLKGRKILAPVMSEIYTDEEAAKFVAALVRNTAIPGVIIQPDNENVKVGDPEAEAIKENFKRKFGGDNRGEPLITNFAAKVTQIGFSPEQMQFKEVRRLPEERVAAQFRLPPQVAGLGAGLDNNTYSNYEEAERHAYRSVCIPLWDDMGEDLDLALSDEFRGSETTLKIAYDYRNVRALNESTNDKTNRAKTLFVIDGITRAELREQTGYTVEEDRDNKFLSELRAEQAAERAKLNPQPQTPPQNPAKRILRDAETLIKALPPGDYDNALEMTQESIVKEAGESMEKDLDTLFKELGKAAEREAAESVDINNPEEESKRIAQAAIKAVGLFLLIRAIWGKMGKSVESETIVTVSLRLAVESGDVWDAGADAEGKSLLLSLARKYEGDLSEQTRKAVETALRGAANGDSLATIGKAVKSQVSGREQYPGVFEKAYNEAKGAGATDAEATRAGESKARRVRAQLIADTETRNYQNAVTLLGYEKTGIEKVKVRDGDGCGWKNHEDKDKADGTERTITEAKKRILAHPRCKRRFYPVDTD